ncbi:MAG: phytoene desaturase family protein [Pseudomonadota bacterium]
MGISPGRLSIPSPKERIAVVGAGIAGLTTAALLASRADVTVYERDEHAGGKLRQVVWGNRAIDCGPTVFTLRPIFEEIFRLCGEQLEDHVELTPLDVLARHAWLDGSRLDLFAEREATIEAIAGFAGQREADAYVGFLKYASQTWETLYGPFIRHPKPSFPGMVLRTPPHRLVRLNPYLSLWQELENRFNDPRLQQLFGRYTTYCGSSPFKAPGTLSLIAHIEQEGVWSVKGGIRTLADALTRICEKRGVSFEFGADIEAIKTERGRVVGLDGASDEQFPIVVFNGDVDALTRGRLDADREADQPLKKPARRTQSAVTLCFLGRAEGMTPAMHNVLFADDYRAEFDNVFEKNTLPDEPTTYVFAPDFDKEEQESQRFFCLINAPAHGDTKTYSEEERRRCQSKILHHLKACGLTLTPEPETMVTTTPTDFAERFPATGGALFGQPIHGVRASFQRPGIRTRTRGLYRAGGSIHPGSGVPMAALSGLMAAETIIKDYGLT